MQVLSYLITTGTLNEAQRETQEETHKEAWWVVVKEIPQEASEEAQ